MGIDKSNDSRLRIFTALKNRVVFFQIMTDNGILLNNAMANFEVLNDDSHDQVEIFLLGFRSYFFCFNFMLLSTTSAFPRCVIVCVVDRFIKKNSVNIL